MCSKVDIVLKLSEEEGNFVFCISNSGTMEKVIWMNSPTSPSLMLRIGSPKQLEYGRTKDRPHDPATEYFVCNECRTIIVYPNPST